MKRRFAALPAAAALLAGACLSTQSRGDGPALALAPTDSARAELRRVVSEALHVDDVMLADDALTDSSWLIVERRRLSSLEGSVPDGRDTSRPERFQLVSEGARCVLVHERSGRRYELAEMRCAAAPR